MTVYARLNMKRTFIGNRRRRRRLYNIPLLLYGSGGGIATVLDLYRFNTIFIITKLNQYFTILSSDILLSLSRDSLRAKVFRNSISNLF